MDEWLFRNLPENSGQQPAQIQENCKDNFHEKQFLWGANLRYGGHDLIFFLEEVYENIEGQDKYTIAYGRDYKIASFLTFLIVQFGIRTEYNKSFKISKFFSIVNLNWIPGSN